MLAEQIGTLGAFHDGPTLWIFGVGDRQGAFDAFDIDRRLRGKITDATIATVRALLDGESVTAAAGDWRVRDAMVSPLPRHRALLMVAGAAAGAVARAGRLGDGWLTSQIATDDELARQLDAYRAACTRYRRRPFPVLRRDIFVAPTDKAASAHVAPILAEGYRGVSADQLLVGSPERVIDQLAEYDRRGFHHVLVRHVTGDHNAMLQSFDLIGRDIVPVISRWPEQ